ncbi:MAG TPA: peptide deformylase [Acidobacteriaceae bacterium]|nr:peptide deformylase [Acidobacteriaceae bacterium]
MSEKKENESATAVAADQEGAKIHPIVKYPDPVLSKKGAAVTEFGPELAQFVEEMWASMYAARGIGLAAPQIGVSKRITVIDVSFKERPEERLVLINPEIVERAGKQFEEEGCLSLPEIREKVQRSARVKVRAQDVNGEFFEAEGEELLARAMQHEIDHLDGVLFIDRLSALKRDLVKRRIRKLQKNGEW